MPTSHAARYWLRVVLVLATLGSSFGQVSFSAAAPAVSTQVATAPQALPAPQGPAAPQTPAEQFKRAAAIGQRALRAAPSAPAATLNTPLAPICSSPNLVIPDENSITDSINVTQTGNIVDLNVSISATHTAVGDLIITLTRGSSVRVINTPTEPDPPNFGCVSNHLPNITLDDDGGSPGTPIQSSCDPNSNNQAFQTNGSYTPNAPLSGFDGQSLNGSWVLSVEDVFNQDSGRLQQWCIIPTVTGGVPVISVTPASLAHTMPATTVQTSTLTVSNVGTGTLDWNSFEDGTAPYCNGTSAISWLSMSFTGGSVAAQPDTPDVIFNSTGFAPGTYTGALCITSIGNPTVTVPLTLNVTAAPAPDPVLQVTPASLSQSQATNTIQTTTVTIANTGPGGSALNWSTFEDGSVPYNCAASAAITWFTGPATSGNINGVGSTVLTVTFNSTGLGAGTYTSSYCVTSNDPNNLTVTVPLTLNVTGAPPDPVISVTPSSLTQTQPANATQTQSLTVANTGPGSTTLTWNTFEDGSAPYNCAASAAISWFSVTPTSGNTGGGTSTPLTGTFNSTGLAPGTYLGALCVTSNDPTNLTVTVPLTLNVSAPPPDPAISVSPSALSQIQAPNVSQTRGLTVTNTGQASTTLTWNTFEDGSAPYNCAASAGISWFSVTPTSGNTSGGASTPLTGTFNSTGLAPGTYQGALCVTSNDPTNLTVTVPLTLFVPNIAVVLTKTVGTTAGTCAATTAVTDTTYAYSATYCYRLQNTGDFTLTAHSLWDAHLGVISSSVPYILAPGVITQVLRTIAVTQSITSTAVWTATNSTYNFVGTDSSNAASVTLLPALAYGPGSFAVTLTVGTNTANRTLFLTNTTRGVTLTWSLTETYGNTPDPSFVPVTLPPLGDRTQPINLTEAAPVELVAPQVPEAQPSVTEDFTNVALLPGYGWAILNRSEPLGTSTWAQGNPSSFSAYNGDPTAYIGANYLSTSGNGTISNWLLTPPLVVQNGATLTFYTRVPANTTFADRMEVRLSTSGTLTDVGSSSTTVGVFTHVLTTINPSLIVTGYPLDWAQFTLVITNVAAPTTGRIAFRYYVTSGGPQGSNSNYIGLDAVRYFQPNATCTTPAGLNMPWLTLSAASGNITGLNSASPVLTFNATGLTGGYTFKGKLCLKTNDPASALTPISIPIDFTVLPYLTYVPFVRK